MGLSTYTDTGLTLYVLFRNHATGVAMTEDAVLDAGWYEAADAAIAAALLPAGTYTGTFREGTAASPSASDPVHGTFSNFIWSGSAEITPETEVLDLVLSLVPPSNDTARTWVMRRGTTARIIAKAAAEAPMFWADVSRLLGDGDVITGTPTIAGEAGSNLTITDITKAGHVIQCKIAGGDVGETPEVIFTFNILAGGAPIICRGELRIL